MGKLGTVVRTAVLLFVHSRPFASAHDHETGDAQCVNGFITNVTNPNITSSSFISEGFYLFPTAKFKCSGRILGLQGRAYFDTAHYYNETLVLSLQFWKENQGHYAAPLQNHSVSLFTEQIDNTVNISTNGTLFPGLFIFYNNLTWTFSISLEEAIEVEAGDVLAVYLPPTTGSVPVNVVNSIPLGIADGPGVRVQGPTSCWSPSQGRFTCHQLLSSTGLPLLSFNFEHSPGATTAPSRTPAHQPSNATLPSQLGLYFFIAVGTAGLFAFLFLLAAITVLVLVCAVVAVSRRNRKSIATHATELELTQQAVPTYQSLMASLQQEENYEKLYWSANAGSSTVTNQWAQHSDTGQLSCGHPSSSEAAADVNHTDYI